jgi:hypothetical protein
MTSPAASRRLGQWKPILASPLSYESFGDMRPVPSCRKKHNQDCEHEPRARAHKSVLHTHGMTALEVEENSLIGVSE